MKLHQRLAKAGAALIAVAVAVAGCSAAGSDSADGTSAAQAGAVSDDNVITYLEPQFFRTLYPPAAGFYPNGGVVNQITDRLLYQNPETLELEPWIATELPEINDDATEFTFNIRTDVTYSDGTPMTAENIVRNFDTWGLGDEDRLLTVSEQISNYERGEVIDDDTVRFHFSAPAPGFPQATSSYNAGLVSDSTLDFDIEGFGPGNAVNVIGSGPFVIESETLNTELFLATREDYDWAPPSHPHQGRAKIDGVRFVLASELSVRSGAMVSDQAQIAREIAAPEENLMESRGVNIVSRGTNAVNNQMVFRFDHPLLQDIRVRQAILHAIDREDIVRILFSESYPLAKSTVAETGLGFKDQSAAYTFDPEESKRLLDEAGWTVGSDGVRTKDGEVLRLRVNEALPQPRSREVMTMVQDDLRDIGIVMDINPGDTATQSADSLDINKIQLYHSMVARADYDVIKSMYSIDNRDVFINQDADGNAIDQHLEDLLQEIAALPTEAEREAVAHEIQDYITEQAYAVPFFEEPQVYAVQPYVHGFEPEAVARPSFYGVWIDQEARTK